ncbi:MAG: T9SS type A sorting domain-containing protein [Bradyrhizobiaceae bacterium]|nr:T9SS type A sorting domain-containing protein [Bradyrhizobiaceae bacterium]
MHRRFALWSTYTLGVAVLLAVLIGIGTQSAHAQANKPELPTLSLTGTQSGWNTTYYPDGRIWSAQQGTNGRREMLVPVFIKNCWRTTADYEAFPIYSFKFKVQFDSSALKFIGVEKNGPLRGIQNTPLTCLARDFEFSSHVARDTTYQSVINAPIQNRLRGKRVMIDAVSSKPLPQTGDITTPCDQRPFTELCFLRFEVIARPGSDPVSSRTPMILTNDTLWYNDFQVGFERPFPNDPQPSTYAGLGGVDNFYFDNNLIEQVRDPLRPSRPGMLWVEVTDLIPALSFTNVADPRFRLVDSVANSNGTEWFVVDPITIDSGSNYDDNVNGIGTRDIDVINAVLGTRAYDITVQSDQPWLKFKSFLKGGPGEINPFPQPSREGYVAYLDKGILGTTLGMTPMGDNTTPMRDLNMRIICDPNELPKNDNDPIELAGIYVGHLTFESNSIAFSPVRIKVTFIYFRAPFEPNEFDENNQWQTRPGGAEQTGIRIELRNSADPVQRTYLVMGVGARATDNADLLFGEGVWENPLSGFGARWYPKDKEGNDIYPNGLSDLWAATASRPKAASRDIRNIYSDTTLLYWCRFNAGNAANYPVVVSWDVDNFSPSSDLFIRDTLNGSRFNVNMRNATNIGGSNYSFTIRDADINAFVIEYTLPKVARFPVINKGWNLLSVPVNPSSSYWKDVFKNSLNIPIRFSQNMFQTSETSLAPGFGYFVKYSNTVDKTVAGSRINKINSDVFPTLLTEGWNTIGSLSTPVGTNKVNVLALPTSTSNPTIESDIYRYVTDRGYQAVSEITPGLGYFVKIAGEAYLQMDPSMPKAGVDFSAVRSAMQSSATRVTVLDAENRTADVFVAENGTVEALNVFELPPLPPNNLFDVRFSNNAYVETANNPLIRLQGVDFPVVLTMNNPAQNYTVVNPVSGEVLGTILAGRSNSITLTDSRTPAVRLMGGDVVAGSAVVVSPNPVQNAANVTYTVSVAGNVTVELFNAVGQLVQTLVADVKTAGVYDANFNANTLAAGRYIVKVTNGNTVNTSTITVVR